MTNKQAPYKNTEIMRTVEKWWISNFPSNHTLPAQHVIELYHNYEEYTGMTPYGPGWVDLNQFAKCLVAAQIADTGNGIWRRLAGWQPKPYEIARAKVY